MTPLKIAEQPSQEGGLLPCPFCGGPAVNVAGEYIRCGAPHFLDCAGRQVRTDREGWDARNARPSVVAMAREALAAVFTSWGHSADAGAARSGSYDHTIAFAKIAALATNAPATSEAVERMREALFETITDADDRVFNARETLDQYADDEPNDNDCANVRDDSQKLHDAWKAVKNARNAYLAVLAIKSSELMS